MLAVVSAPPTPNDRPRTKEFVTYVGAADWVGFRRSSQGVHRHYEAKCDHCSVVMAGRSQTLRANKDNCTERPEEKIPFMMALLEPFTIAIKLLERENCVLGEVWETFIRIRRYLKIELKRDDFPERYNRHLTDRLSRRESQFADSLLIVALYLMPAYRLICMSKKYSVMNVHKMAFELFKKWFSINDRQAIAFRDDI